MNNGATYGSPVAMSLLKLAIANMWADRKSPKARISENQPNAARTSSRNETH